MVEQWQQAFVALAAEVQRTEAEFAVLAQRIRRIAAELERSAERSAAGVRRVLAALGARVE